MLASTRPDINRPRASELFARFPGADRAGFTLETPSPGPGKFRLEILLEGGPTLELAQLRLHTQDQPRLLYMHVPKAAGSTVNAFLQNHFRRSKCAIHIETDPRWHSDINQIRDMDFVSGHVTLPALAARLNLDDYYVVTAVRNPFFQVVSHLAWIRKLAEKSEAQRFQRHPEYVQQLALKLKATDLSRPRSLRRLIASLNQSETRLLDNCQLRYFVKMDAGELVTGDHVAQAQDSSQIFDRIGTTEHIGEFLQGVAEDLGWARPGRLVTQNVAQSYFGLDARKARLRKALEPLVRHDLELVRFIRKARDRSGRRN